ncbi:heme d1 biosynthesis radical SAM protein NirJ [Thalassospira alkalitolerans]|uniref:heme d1 biosynthesis radical SAM protein NirJ n=1 Tax=Thalassospira alkalitolerans TaxID=1293890 RepID=UPI003AA80B66
MLRLSQYIRTAINISQNGVVPSPAERKHAALANRGPVVIWNLIRRCNLTCRHCYASAVNKDFPGELSTKQVFKTMENLRDFNVPVLILSGGEPLMRPDIFDISAYAKELGFYVALSSNGTLIDDTNIDQIANADYDYVGVSLDGLNATHDYFRRLEGGFDLALRGAKLCRDAGLPVGIRFTMTRENYQDLPGLLDLVEQERIDKFYFSHLNYAGRGNHNRKDHAFYAMTREALLMMFARCEADVKNGIARDYVTGNNDADGVFLKFWIDEHYPEASEQIGKMLRRWGGNASGVNVANIDNLGNVHPDTMWWQHTLGNVLKRPFSEIWQDVSDPLMAGLKQRPRLVHGRCGACQYRDICGGNTRTRAYQLTGDPWAEDPGCYLDDMELGITGDHHRLETVPFSATKRHGQVGLTS